MKLRFRKTTNTAISILAMRNGHTAILHHDGGDKVTTIVKNREGTILVNGEALLFSADQIKTGRSFSYNGEETPVVESADYYY